MKHQKNIAKSRFAACTAGAALLFFFAEAARRVTAGGFSGNFNFSTGGHFRDDFILLTDQNNLTRHEIFRGKISRRNNQKQKTTSMKGRFGANTHE